MKTLHIFCSGRMGRSSSGSCSCRCSWSTDSPSCWGWKGSLPCSGGLGSPSLRVFLPSCQRMGNLQETEIILEKLIIIRHYYYYVIAHNFSHIMATLMSNVRWVCLQWFRLIPNLTHPCQCCCLVSSLLYLMLVLFSSSCSMSDNTNFKLDNN